MVSQIPICKMESQIQQQQQQQQQQQEKQQSGY
jgi:hypothetical protein